MIDATVGLAELSVARVEELSQLEPMGQGNPTVRLVVGGLRHQQSPQRMGKENQHVKFRVTDGKQVLEAVWWNGGKAPWPEEKFDLAVTAGINDYKGRRTVQLKVLDWRPLA
jgi:single-stranded-DNA-specific exonuclease